MKSMALNWSKITLESYLEIIEADGNGSDDIEMLSIILDLPIEEIEEYDYDTFLEYKQQINFIYTPITNQYKREIDIKGYKFHVIEFNKIEFGAFIDIEWLLKDDQIYNMSKIYSILYRQVVKGSTILSKIELEPYGDWLDVRGSLFSHAIIEDIYGALSSYLNWRNNIFETYEGLFQESEDELNEREESEMLREMTGTEREEYYKEKNVAGYGWELMLLRLANNNALKMTESAKIPIIQALNTLGMMNTLKIG